MSPKYCPACGTVKDNSEFYRIKNRKGGGLDSYCRIHRKEKSAQNYKNHKRDKLKKNAQHYFHNRKRISAENLQTYYDKKEKSHSEVQP